MNYPLISSIVISSLCCFSLYLIWYETIAKWTFESNQKMWVEDRCWSPDVGCTVPQNPVMQMSALGIAVLGLMIFHFCYFRFDCKTNYLESKNHE